MQCCHAYGYACPDVIVQVLRSEKAEYLDFMALDRRSRTLLQLLEAKLSIDGAVNAWRYPVS